MRETRTFFDVEIRADDDGAPGVTLQCIKPGVVDDYGSLWKANAFDESLEERLPVLCWAHDWSNPLGPGVEFQRSRNGPKVRFKFSDFEAVPQAKRAHAQVLDGTIQDCSVGFSNTQRREPTDEERQKYPGIYEVIEKATLDEVSLVIRGAVPGAKVLAVRSARMADGSTVDAEFVVDMARKVAAGEMTQAEAKAAIELVAQGPTPPSSQDGEAITPAEPGDGAGEEPGGEASAPDPGLDQAALEATALAAEALVLP